jgi:hypothetical protein
LTEQHNLALNVLSQCHAGITGIYLAEDAHGFPLELLTQLNVILLVHFASLEIKIQITNGGIERVFLQQQMGTGRGTGIV